MIDDFLANTHSSDNGELLNSIIGPSISQRGLGHDDASKESRQWDRSLWAWSRLIEDYTRLDLTFDKDKLPVVSGIARRFHQMTHWQYHVGLWQECLPLSLSSFVIKPSPADLGSYGCPSWSWASHAGAVRFYDKGPGTVETANILEVISRTANDDSFGPMIEGYLRILAPKVDLAMDSYSGRAGFLPPMLNLTLPQDICLDNDNLPFSHRSGTVKGRAYGDPK